MKYFRNRFLTLATFCELIKTSLMYNFFRYLYKYKHNISICVEN